MIIVILLSCLTIMVSTLPVHPNALPPLISQGGATQVQAVQSVEATNQKPDAQTPAPLSPIVEQPQPQGGPQFLPPAQHYTWSPLGGSPMIISLQPANQPTQQPLMFPPYRYFPIFSSPYSNQQFSSYGFPMILGTPLPQTPASQPPNSPVLSAEAPFGAAATGNALQPMQQQQNPQIVYMLQQSMSSPLGSLSSEELEMVAKIGQLGVYLPTVLTISPAAAVQPVNQAAGLTNQELQGIVPTVATSSAGAPQKQGLTSSGRQPNTNGVPVGLERPADEAATVQTPAQPKLQLTQGVLV